MNYLSKTSLIGLSAISMTVLPSFAQTHQVECSNGQAVITTNNAALTVPGTCKKVNIAGNGNTVTTGKIVVLSLMGNANTVSAQDVVEVTAGGNNNTLNYGGDKPKHWFGGDGNKLVRGTTPTVSKAPTRQKPTLKRRETPKPNPSTSRQTNANTATGLPSNIDNMWFIYRSYSGGKWAAMTLKDGTITTDINTVYAEGVAASKRKKPERLGHILQNRRRRTTARKVCRLGQGEKVFHHRPQHKDE